MPGTPAFGASPPPTSPPRFGSFGGSFGPLVDCVKPPRPPCSTPRRQSQVLDACQVDELDTARSQESDSSRAARLPPPVGRLDCFRVLSTVGRGCFGDVLLAEAPSGEQVAIKSVCEDAGRELREVELLRRIRHPCVVRMLEAFRAPSATSREMCLHIVMEYLPENMHEHIRGRPVGSLDFRSFSFQLLRALAHLHGERICHRDVKPENLLLGAPPVASGSEAAGLHCTRALKLADFGSAKRLGGGRSTSYICARWWRAPELIVGFERYSSAVDWWSCGCVLAEMMLGRPLFPGTSSVGQLDTIIKELGAPTAQELLAIGAPLDGPLEAEIAALLKPRRHGRPWEQLLPAYAGERDALELVSRLLVYDPSLRVAPARALCCRAFKELIEVGPLPPGMLDFTPEELQGCDFQTQQELVGFAHRQQRRSHPAE